jgi:hypothetical protein
MSDGYGYALLYCGRQIKIHPTRLACVIEAIERKLIVTSLCNINLAAGVEIKQVPAHDQG